MRAALHAIPFSGMLAIVVKLEKEIPLFGKRKLNRKGGVTERCVVMQSGNHITR